MRYNRVMVGAGNQASIIGRMSADEFTKLFQYMTDRFDRIDHTLEQKADKADVQRTLDVLDKVLKQQ